MGRPQEFAVGNVAPQVYQSTNRRSSLTEPEVWFRIVHVTPELRDVRQEPTDRAQTVEIALGPTEDLRKRQHRHPDPPGARRSGSKCRPALAGQAETAAGAQDPPRVSELLRKAIKWRALLMAGEAATQAAIARSEGITRARVTQILGLLRLAPEIQHRILSMPDTAGKLSITEHALRRVTRLEQLGAQRQAFQQLVGQHSPQRGKRTSTKS